MYRILNWYAATSTIFITTNLNKTATAGPSYTKGGNVWYVMGISKKAWRSFLLLTSHQPIPSLHHNPRPHHHLLHSPPSQHLRLFPPPAWLPRTYSFPKSPQNLPSQAPTTPALKTALPAAPPARLQSCSCLHAPISTPAQHPPSRPFHPHPIPHLPGPSTTRTNAAPLTKAATFYSATKPLTDQQHPAAYSETIDLPHPSAPLQHPPTTPAFAHQRRARWPPPDPPHAASRPCTLSQAPPPFPLKP